MEDRLWTDGIPPAACTCEVRPKRQIALWFPTGHSDVWEPWDIRLCTFGKVQDGLYLFVGNAGIVRWPAVAGGMVVVNEKSPVLWRPIVFPEGV